MIRFRDHFGIGRTFIKEKYVKCFLLGYISANITALYSISVTQHMYFF